MRSNCKNTVILPGDGISHFSQWSIHELSGHKSGCAVCVTDWSCFNVLKTLSFFS